MSVAFDLPTLYGYYDADHTHGLPGRWANAAFPSARWPTWKGLFDGIPLDQVSTSMTITSTASIALAIVTWPWPKNRGLVRTGCEGTVQNDILKEYMAQKEVDISAATIPPAGAGFHCLLQPALAELESDQHQRLPHP